MDTWKLRLPSYSPEAVEPGILHIGTGKFALAFLGSYVQDILAADPSWGIVASSIRSCNIVHNLSMQSGVYVLAEQEGDYQRLSVMAPIVETVAGATNFKTLVGWVADPKIKLVTLTITTEGYYLHNDKLDMDDQAIQHDLSRSPASPKTVYGYLSAGLALRKQRTGSPLTIMSLDNRERNGQTFEEAMQTFLRRSDPDTESWLRGNVQFLTTMVDRIVPSSDADIDSGQLQGTELVIRTECFKDLVIAPCTLRFHNPSWTRCGAKLVSDCGYYWKRKAYLVNGGHHVIAVCGQRLGYEFVHEALHDRQVLRLLTEAHNAFIDILCRSPNCPDTPETIAVYASRTRERFANRHIVDCIDRIGRSSTRKVAQRFFEPIWEGYQQTNQTTVPSALVFSAAVWIFNLSNVNEKGVSFEQEDALAEKLVPLNKEFKRCASGKASEGDVRRFLIAASSELNDPRFKRVSTLDDFVGKLTHSLHMIASFGLKSAINNQMTGCKHYL